MKPSQETYEDLNRLAQTGQSFDGRPDILTVGKLNIDQCMFRC